LTNSFLYFKRKHDELILTRGNITEKLSMVDLIDALCNPTTQDKLARLVACRKRLLSGAPAQVEPTPRPPARAGEILKAVEAVLATHGTMRVGEVFLAVQNMLGREVNRGTVKACLSEGTMTTPPKFMRASRGRYRLAYQTPG
jgi:hypothetical protein